MKPLEGMLLGLMTLNKREKERLKQELGIMEGTPCERNGHKYKLVDREVRILLPPRRVMVCTQCGDKIKV